MKFILFVLVITIINVCFGDYIYMKPFSGNSQCTGGVEEGVGYIFNVGDQGSGCIQLSNVTDRVSLKVNIFGEIGSFIFYSDSSCTTSTFSDAFKHNQCYSLPSILNFNNDSNTEQYFQISFIDDVGALEPIIGQVYGLKKFQSQFQSTCSNINFEYLQFVTNNYTFTSASSSSSSSSSTTTLFCHDEVKLPTSKQCSDNQCTIESLSLPCANINNYNLMQTC